MSSFLKEARVARADAVALRAPRFILPNMTFHLLSKLIHVNAIGEETERVVFSSKDLCFQARIPSDWGLPSSTNGQRCRH